MIKFLVMDVDGTLTDGKIYIGNNGEVMKVFDVKDGCGIKDILPQYSIVPIIITARTSEMLKIRCKELGIEELYQGERNKLKRLLGVLDKYSKMDGEKYELSNVAYIGDDILDLSCMIPIHNAGGLVGCPADAVDPVKNISDYICKALGGHGAVREFINCALQLQ